MAIVSGFIQSKYRKSIGNVTYAMLGGDIIAREKITTNASNTALQAAQRSLFKQSMSFIRWLNPYANIAYRRNGRRSAYAEFTKRMYPGVSSLLAVNEDALEPDYLSFLTALKKANELTGGNTPAIQGDFAPVSITYDTLVNGEKDGTITLQSFFVNIVLDKVPDGLDVSAHPESIPLTKNAVTVTGLRPETDSNGALIVGSNSVQPGDVNVSEYETEVLPSGFVKVRVKFDAGNIPFYTTTGSGFDSAAVGGYLIPLIRVPGLGVARVNLSDLGAFI